MEEARPKYGFNRHLDVETIDPPVQIAARWAQSYPISSSPLYGLTDRYPLLNLAQGVPGHPPPDAFLERLALEALPQNATSPAGHSHGYGPVFGDPKLRQAVARDINRVYRSEGGSKRNEVTEWNVGITSGCNMAFATVAMSIAGPGDAIILNSPWYFNHHMTLTSLGIQVAQAQTRKPDYFPDVEYISALLEADSKATVGTIKAVVLVTPNNPTGSVYPPDLILKIAVLCNRYSVALILDETYRDFLTSHDHSQFDRTILPGDIARPHDLFQDTPFKFESTSWEPEWDWRSTVIHLFSFSKSYAIPGHRLGGFVAHSSFLQQIVKDVHGNDVVKYGPTAKALDNLQVSPPRTDTQRAVAWAIEDPGHMQWRAEVAHHLLERRSGFVQNLSTKQPVERLNADCTLRVEPITSAEAKSADSSWFVESGGAYYIYLNHPFAELTSEQVAQALAEIVGVVVLPGSFFMHPTDASKLARDDSAATRLRVSIANVSAEKLAMVPERLEILSEYFDKKGIKSQMN